MNGPGKRKFVRRLGCRIPKSATGRRAHIFCPGPCDGQEKRSKLPGKRNQGTARGSASRATRHPVTTTRLVLTDGGESPGKGTPRLSSKGRHAPPCSSLSMPPLSITIHPSARADEAVETCACSASRSGLHCHALRGDQRHHTSTLPPHLHITRAEGLHRRPRWRK